MRRPVVKANGFGLVLWPKEAARFEGAEPEDTTKPGEV